MNLGLYSLYWDNIDPKIVAAQKRVCDRLALPLRQHRIDGLDHGEWIDWVMARHEDTKIFCFLDIDCIPLSVLAVKRGESFASTATLYGAAACANHLDPNRAYAGAWYVYVSRLAWAAHGKPSARATVHTDVCQLWTDTWNDEGGRVQLIPAAHCAVPCWNLPDKLKAYGIGTTYEENCYHLFEARSGEHTELFLAACAQVAPE